MPKKELPLVALFGQEKIVFFSPGFSLPSGAGQLEFQYQFQQQNKINNISSFNSNDEN